MSDHVVVAAAVDKRYEKRSGNSRTEFQALEQVDLSVSEGEFLCIVGASGCGKSTLLRILAGLTEPTSGQVHIAGRPVQGPSQEAAVVFQAHSLLPWRTVLGNIEIGMESPNQSYSRKERRDRAKQYAELVGMGGFEGAYPHEISGGMQQRVNLARALAVESSVILMDEPFAALDSQTRELMQQELLNIWRKNRRTVIFITHQIDEAMILADRVVIMGSKPGRIRECIDITFPRPRELALKHTPEFLNLSTRIWNTIEHDVKAGMLDR